MKLKSLSYFIINRNYILKLIFVMIVFAFIVTIKTSHPGNDAGYEFIKEYNGHSTIFLLQIPMVLFALLPVYTKLQNDLLRVRFLSRLSFYYLRLKAVLIISVLYILIKAVIELLFLLIIDGHWLISLGYNFLIIYLIQIGTLFFVSILLLMLQELLNNNVFAILLFLFIMGIDLLSCTMPLYGLRVNLNLFIIPMGLLKQQAIYLIKGIEPINYVYQYSSMILKIFIVILITHLSIKHRRREYLGQKS